MMLTVSPAKDPCTAAWARSKEQILFTGRYQSVLFTHHNRLIATEVVAVVYQYQLSVRCVAFT